MSKYIIRNGMELNCSIPIKGNANKVLGLFKKGTNIKVPGEYSFNINENELEMSYLLEEGVATFETEVKMETPEKDIISSEVELKVRQRNKPQFYKEYLKEYYFKEEPSIRNTINYDNKESNVCTSILVAVNDKNLNSKTLSFNLDTKSTSIYFKTANGAGVRVECEIRHFFTSNNVKISFIDSVNVTFEKSPAYLGTEYISIELKDFIERESLDNVDIRTYRYFKINNRTIDAEYIEENDIKVPAYIRFDQPKYFLKSNTKVPEIPTDEEFQNPINGDEIGDRFLNTLAHNEFAPDGSRSIKVGKTVPDNAVNLAYYHNKTATFDNALSVVETNSNSVTLKKIEKWSHRRRLKEKDDDIFQDSIEFNGEDGTEFEGYWGILYKEKVLWDEEIDLDQEQEFKRVYLRYNGVEKKVVPINYKFNDSDKFGNLKLTHRIFQPNYFEKDLEDLYPIQYSPRMYSCNARYDGFIRLIKTFYNASCKYSGIITKRDGMSNLDPEQQREILMYPNEEGILEDSSGNSAIEDDLFLITDKFSDGIPLYYKHKLKYKIYDSIGIDQYGSFKSNKVKLVYENGIELNPSKYKYKFTIVPTEFKNIYEGYIYTNFVPSHNSPAYVLYDAIDQVSKNYAYDLKNKIGLKEKLSLVEAIDSSQYDIEIEEGLTRKSIIKFHDFTSFDDQRNKIRLKYYIEAEGLKSEVMDFDLIGKKYALTEELKNYRGDNLIISPKVGDKYLSAKDILFKNISDEEKQRITEDSIFKCIYYTEDNNTKFNKDKGILYTNPNGLDVVFVKTYFDTGMPSNNSSNPNYNRTLDDSSIYITKEGKIFKGYSIKCKNINQIVISSPRETSPYKGWFPKVRYSYFSKVYERIDKTIQLIYSVPEFFSQVFGKYGAPYLDVEKEKARLIGRNTIKTANYPLYIIQETDWTPKNLEVYKISIDGTRKDLDIKSFSFMEGIVELEDSINDNDNVFVNYSYEESYYNYKGFYEDGDKSNKLININLNPSFYFKYTDTKNEIHRNKQTYDLFNRTIHFFLRPTRVIDKETGEVITDNKFTIYHKFDDQAADGSFDLHIGRIFIRHHASLKSTEIIDTRRRGGGVLEIIKDSLRRELEPESDFYLDIGTLDGKPFQGNSVIVIKIHNKILKVNGGRFTEGEVEEAVRKWCSVGTFPIIEYVDVIEDSDMPQQTLIVNRHISNIFDFTPSFKLEVIE